MNGVVRIRRRGGETDAVLYDGTNAALIVAWSQGNAYVAEGQLIIMTNRGDVVAEPGEHVVRGLDGSYYPPPPSAFEAGWEVIG